MDFERKSERNQRLADLHKFERKERKVMRPKIPAPRFSRGIEVPVVPEGKELHKFYGRPIFLPARIEGEDLVGKTPYTKCQIEAIMELVNGRQNNRFEGNIIKTFGIYIDGGE